MLVDVDQRALTLAKERLDDLQLKIDVITVREDAAAFQDGRRYDLVLMNSAYHHIENDKKAAFLVAARRSLSADGWIIMGEHFLPEYTDRHSFRESVIQYYSAIIEELIVNGEPSDAIQVIRQAGLYSWLGEYEYKVSWSIFMRDVQSANLKILSVCRIPCRGLESFGKFVGPMTVALRSNCSD